MTPQQYLNTVKDSLKIQYKGKEQDKISIEKHIEEVNNIIGVLQYCLESARYELELTTIEGEIQEINNTSFHLKQLDKEFLILQPIVIDNDDINDLIDVNQEDLMNALNILAAKKDMNILYLPPNITLVKAKIKKE